MTLPYTPAPCSATAAMARKVGRSTMARYSSQRVIEPPSRLPQSDAGEARSASTAAVLQILSSDL
jgi:hypothetical protein